MFNFKKIAIIFSVLIFVIPPTIFMILLAIYSDDLPKLPEKLDEIVLSPPTEIYDSRGKLLTTLGGRKLVSIERISQNFQKAILTVEDSRFTSHHGIDKFGILRAIFTNFFSGRSQGASTITQQLAKNLFFSFEKKFDRKISEMFLAFQIESQYSKLEILEAYCNQVYFGSGAFGIEKAAETYFAKSSSQLNVAESAMLAGIPKWPSKYNPYVNFEVSKSRQELILKMMYESGVIDAKEYKEAVAFEIELKRLVNTSEIAPYFVNHVKNEATQVFVEKYSLEPEKAEQMLYYGGLKIYTTLDFDVHTKAQRAIQRQIRNLDEKLGFKDYEDSDRKKKFLQTSLVAIEPQSGRILTLIGGRDYNVSQYNRATKSVRQAGSGFKPFVYLTALQSGKYTPKTVIEDKKIELVWKKQKPWRPKNFGNRYFGNLILKKALMKSLNSVAAQLIYDVTPEEVIKTARKFGIKTELNPYLSLALGAQGVSPLQMASAYGVFATEGVYAQPYSIIRIDDYLGRSLIENFVKAEVVFTPQEIFPLVDMLQGVVDGGTGVKIRANGISRPIGGKTGTTNESVDAWFNGFMPDLSCSVWVGFDNNSSMKSKKTRGLTGASGALPIWIDFVKQVTDGKSAKHFPIPAGIEFERVDSETGNPPTESTIEVLKVALVK